MQIRGSISKKKRITNGKIFEIVVISILLLLTTLPLVPMSIATVTEEVRINEFMYNPPSSIGADTDYEWIELYNYGTSEVNLSNWTLDMETIPEAIIPANGYVILSRNQTAFTSFYGTIGCPVLEIAFQLTNSRDTITLKDDSSSIVDEVTYSSEWGGDGNGYTLEWNGIDWRESYVENGTPGYTDIRTPITVTKTIWDGDSWDDTVLVPVGDTVRFNVSIIYNKIIADGGPSELTWISLEDTLPPGLAYAYNATIPETQISPDEKTISWINLSGVTLNEGEQLFLEFNATVIDAGISANTISIEAYETLPHVWHTNETTAMVEGVVPVEPAFEKMVWNGTGWAEEIRVVLGDIVRFNLSLIYPGDDTTYNLTLIDILPDCLEYANNATTSETNVSEDKRTIWWNRSSIQFEGSKPFTVLFDAVVTDSVGCCNCFNEATTLITEENETTGDTYNDTACVIVVNNLPPSRPILEGPTQGIINETLTFRALADNHPEDENISYLFDWGDSTTTGWLGPYQEGIWVSTNHTWNTTGTFIVKAMAQDSHGLESNWSNSLSVEITTVPPEPEADIIIKEIKGGIGVTTIIKNKGKGNATNIGWKQTIDGGILNRINESKEGSISSLVAGGEAAIRITKGIFGLGRININVIVTHGNEPSLNETARGFILGYRVLIIPSL